MQNRIPTSQDYSTEEHLFSDFRPSLAYADFGQRLGALILDLLIVVVGLISADLILNSLLGEALAGFANLAAFWLYFALQESGPKQATFGKRALGIMVTDLNGNRISFGQATGRLFAHLLSHMLFFFGYLMVLWDARRQALHDKVANTLVVRGRPD